MPKATSPMIGRVWSRKPGVNCGKLRTAGKFVTRPINARIEPPLLWPHSFIFTREPAQFDKGFCGETCSLVFFSQSFRYFSHGRSKTVSDAGHDQKRNLSGRSSRKRSTV